MAQVEPMDVETIGGEFDDKENSLHNSNVLPKTPSTEKGYEELDVSELNMKLRFSITPTNSPMSRSYTANYKGDSGPNSLNNTVVIDNILTQSLNSTVNKVDVLKAPKLPLQALPTSLFTNNDRSLAEREGNLTVTITRTENEDNLSLPSTSSSTLNTPEATTPTKDIPKSDGSPIIRGLKSVLNMFRSSHSPVPPTENEDPAENASTPISSSSVENFSKETSEIIPIHEDLETPAMDATNPQLVTSLYHSTTPAKDGQSNTLLASTPISSSIIKDSKNSSKRNSPLKESVVFNEDLERELQWQDETEIFFKYEKIPAHKLLFQTFPINIDSNQTKSVQNNDMGILNKKLEYMDVSNADVSYKSVIEDKTLNDIDTKVSGVESDEFLDCEKTYTQNKSYLLETAQKNKTSPVVFQTDIIPLEAYLEDCNATTNNNNINNDEITIDEKITELIVQSSNFETNNLTSKKPVDDFIHQDNAINLDTDNNNTGRILFKIDEILLKKINLENLKIDIASNNNETKSEFKKASDNSIVCVPNISEKTLPDESRTLNDPVGISNIEETNEDCKNSLEINEVSKITEKLIEHTLVPDGIVDEYNMVNISIKDNMKIKELYSQNIEIDNTSEFKMNPLHISDEKENTSVMDYELNILDEVKNNVSGSTNTHHIISQVQNNEGCQDITMDSLESTLDVNNDQLICEINKTDIHEEENYNRSKQNYNVTISENSKPIELLKNPPLNVTLPSDVPLPSDDDIENDSLLDLCSTKNNTDVVSKIETEKKACVMVFHSNTEPKEAINRTDLSKPFQSFNNHDPNISHSDSSSCVVEELQTNFNSDFEMATAENNIIQDTPFGLLSTNLTSCLQELKVDSNKKEAQQILQKTTENLNDTCTDLVIKSEINVDKATEIPLPDVARAVNNTEQNNLSTQELKTDITNETVCLDLNMNSKVNDDEIVTSANNSPYVSVTELDLNLNSDIPVDQSENAPKPITEAVVSPPTSPKLTRKGYNIDFDANENPFATKTNIRMSPPPGKATKTFTPVNNNQKKYEAQRRSPDRRRPQSEGKKSDANEMNFNTSIDEVKIMNSSQMKKSNIKVVNTVHSEENKTGQDKYVNDVNNLASSLEDLQKEISSSVKCEDDSYTSIVVKTSPDLENQTVLRKCNGNNISTTLNLNNNQETRNVFNIPEIDDINFNPFASKSRMCVTPPPIEVIDPLNSQNDIGVLTDFINENQFKTEQINATVCIDNNVQDGINVTEQDNATVCMKLCIQDEVKVLSNTTSSSINTEDKDVTVLEVNTEDDDTIEGPFFEAEDLLDVVKVPEIEIDKETMQFQDLPTTSNNEQLDKGEIFIDAEAFEFLLNQNKSNSVADSGKESLFLKFDPLFAKRVSSDGALSALSSMAKKQSTPKKLTRAPLVSLARAETSRMPVAGPSNVTSMPEVNNEETVIVAKPMMVVSPAVAKQPVATPRISLTPKTNRQSINFASPAMVVIDRLLSLSGNTSLLDHGDTIDANRNHEANIVFVQLRELLAEKEDQVYTLKFESNQLRERLTTLESQVKSLESEGEERTRKVNMLNERLVEKTKINRSMAVVVEEYERTIAALIAEMEQDKKRNAEERMKLINERDEQTAHLASMEGSFSDLHSKYEKCKHIVLSMKAKEDGYRKSFKQFEEKVLKMEKNYELLKQHATSKLNHANQELEKMNRAHDAEVLKLTAMIKRKDLHITSLEETLTQTKKTNEELTAICDELINKVE